MKIVSVVLFCLLFCQSLLAKTYRSNELYVLMEKNSQHEYEARGLCSSDQVGCIRIKKDRLTLQENRVFYGDETKATFLGEIDKSQADISLPSVSFGYKLLALKLGESKVSFKAKVRSSLFPTYQGFDAPVPSSFMCMPLPRSVLWAMGALHKMNQFKRVRTLKHQLVFQDNQGTLVIYGMAKAHGKFRSLMSLETAK